MKNLFLLMILFVSQAATADFTVTPWVWKKSNCQTCGIAFKIVGDINSFSDMETKEILIRAQPLLWPTFRASDADAKKRTEIFLKTLAVQKPTLLALYKNQIDSQRYNLLASIAVGILGQESRFFANWRYLVKRNAQWGITQWKIVKAIAKENKDNDDVKLSLLDSAKSLLRTKDAAIEPSDVLANSKGPTQIKDVPDRIASHYHITEKDLWEPQAAAVATMGFLIEALQQLKRTAVNSDQDHVINDDTIIDYLPYIYFGGTKKIIKGTATPETNIYVNRMKKFMQKVKVYEVIQ